MRESVSVPDAHARRVHCKNAPRRIGVGLLSRTSLRPPRRSVHSVAALTRSGRHFGGFRSGNWGTSVGSNGRYDEKGVIPSIATPLAAVTHGKNIRSVWCALVSRSRRIAGGTGVSQNLCQRAQHVFSNSVTIDHVLRKQL